MEGHLKERNELSTLAVSNSSLLSLFSTWFNLELAPTVLEGLSLRTVMLPVSLTAMDTSVFILLDFKYLTLLPP